MKKSYIVILAVAVAVIAVCVLALVLHRDNFEEMTGWKRNAYAILFRHEIENTDYVGAVSEETWSPEDVYSLEDTVILQKEPGKDFVVMNITDIHMCDYDYYGPYNWRLLESIRVMAERYQPDLITISGDLFSSDSDIWSAQLLTELMDSLQIPWAPIFGNHDDSGNCDLNYLADVMMKSEYCLMRKGDPSMGVGNYIVNICEGEKLVHSLILMDSHGDGLWENQIPWYRWAASGAEAPSTVIFHIPTVQYEQAYDLAWDEENGCWREGYDAFGALKESICAEPSEDNGFFDAVLEVGLTKNILCGHDHTNSFSIVYEGVRLTYSMRLGIYGNHSGENMGATLLTIDSEGNIQTEHIQRFGE